MNQSVFDPAGPGALQVAHLFWIYLGVCAAVWLLVIIALGLAVGRSRKAGGEMAPNLELSPALERRRRWVVGSATGLTIVILFALLTASILSDRNISSAAATDSLRVEVTAQQWWWSFTIQGANPSESVTVPNELHIPVGRPVQLEMTTPDVIHSFWVPALHGKRDLLPGKKVSFSIQADRPGRYQGQCAEYCGVQHANMRFLIVAEPLPVFERWLARMKAPARQSNDPLARRGQHLFMARQCASCHSIAGTPAQGSVAPDLTHLASRHSIAAGTLPNSAEALGHWVRSPQRYKPGNFMPDSAMAPADIHALVAYLRSLE